MGFSTNTFLFMFLPITIICYFIFYYDIKKNNRYVIGNVVIAIASYIFYSWALDTTAIMLLVYTIIIYNVGQLIYKGRDRSVIIHYKDKDQNLLQKDIKISIVLLVVGLVFAIYILYHFRYYAKISPVIARYFYLDANKYANITIPLGVSFITFSAITYLADIYKQEATPGSLLDCLVYIFFFPKIVSGPIVPWKDFQTQVNDHPSSRAQFVHGVNRIIIGMAKKVILADTFGSFVSSINGANIDAPTAWMGWFGYALQIYYDFAGYSDIAIGLSEIFGFHFDENFNFPYRSSSITEFWRRWHISLGSFFKNYVYIPLGGNRKGKTRTLINLGVVFLITGIWHGAGLAYILWGGYTASV